MAAQSQQPQSMLQGLQQILSELGGMMAAPDADVDFLTQMQHAIVGKIKQSTQQAVGAQHQQMMQAIQGGQGQQQGGGPGGGMGGGMRGLNPGAPASAMIGGVGGGGDMGGGGGAPNADELRRVMGAQGMSQ